MPEEKPGIDVRATRLDCGLHILTYHCLFHRDLDFQKEPTLLSAEPPSQITPQRSDAQTPWPASRRDTCLRPVRPVIAAAVMWAADGQR
jgi:hypothetical protein